MNNQKYAIITYDRDRIYFLCKYPIFIILCRCSGKIEQYLHVQLNTRFKFAYTELERVKMYLVDLSTNMISVKISDHNLSLKTKS